MYLLMLNWNIENSLSKLLFITDRFKAALLLWLTLIQVIPFMSLMLHDFVTTRISGISEDYIGFPPKVFLAASVLIL